MAKTQTKQVTSEPPKAPQSPPATKPPETKPPEAKTTLAMTRRGFEPTDMESAYRFAKTMAQSSIVTPTYRGNEANCIILLDMSMRMGVPWMILMQHVYIVHERPALDSMISTALVNRSGEFRDPLEYEVEGKNAKDNDYRVRAYATRTSTGKVLYGPWIDWALVRGEQWDSKPGSKWKTMPEQMFHYRSASWFQRRYCPELTMGMLTTDEAEEIPAKHVESTVVEPGVDGLKKLLADREQQNGNGAAPPQGAEPQGEGAAEPESSELEPVDPNLRDAETEAKVAAEKEKLGLSPAGAGAGGGKRKSNLF